MPFTPARLGTTLFTAVDNRRRCGKISRSAKPTKRASVSPQRDGGHATAAANGLELAETTHERPNSVADSGKSITHCNFSQLNFLRLDRASADRTMIRASVARGVTQSYSTNPSEGKCHERHDGSGGHWRQQNVPSRP
jgi:hypothetical protein